MERFQQERSTTCKTSNVYYIFYLCPFIQQYITIVRHFTSGAKRYLFNPPFKTPGLYVLTEMFF